MNAIKSKLPALVQEELDVANVKFPPFASMHEGYAVLLVEMEEANEEVAYIENSVKAIWRSVKANNIEVASFCADRVEDHAIRLAAEAIQVAAMARKFQAILKEEKA